MRLRSFAALLAMALLAAPVWAQEQRGSIQGVVKRNSGKSTNIRAEQVDLLPHNRDFLSLVTQAPGVNNETKSAGIMIDGAAAAENRYVIDGIETTDIVGGTSGKNLLADFVEE